MKANLKYKKRAVGILCTLWLSRYSENCILPIKCQSRPNVDESSFGLTE